MILIGISGDSGAGKTTLANLLLTDEKKKVICLDKILDDIKKMMPSGMFHNQMDYSTGQVNKRLDTNSKLFSHIKNNEYLLFLYNNLRIATGVLFLRKEIKKAEKEGYSFIIFEGCSLSDYISFSELDYSIYVSLNIEKRCERIFTREGKESIILKNGTYALSQNDNPENFNIIIDNGGTIEDLNNKSTMISGIIKNELRSK